MATAAEVLQAARYWGVTIATAESCTGGMISAALTDVAGSSDVFDRGFVTYSNEAKMQMLGVRHATLEAHGAVSEAVAREMAEGALEFTAGSGSVANTNRQASSRSTSDSRMLFAFEEVAAADSVR